MIRLCINFFTIAIMGFIKGNTMLVITVTFCVEFRMLDSLLLLSNVSLPGCKIVVLEEERIVQVESIDVVLK